MPTIGDMPGRLTEQCERLSLQRVLISQSVPGLGDEGDAGNLWGEYVYDLVLVAL